MSGGVYRAWRVGIRHSQRESYGKVAPLSTSLAPGIKAGYAGVRDEQPPCGTYRQFSAERTLMWTGRVLKYRLNDRVPLTVLLEEGRKLGLAEWTRGLARAAEKAPHPRVGRAQPSYQWAFMRGFHCMGLACQTCATCIPIVIRRGFLGTLVFCDQTSASSRYRRAGFRLPKRSNCLARTVACGNRARRCNSPPNASMMR